MGTFRGLYFRGVMVPTNIAKIFPLRIFYVYVIYLYGIFTIISVNLLYMYTFEYTLSVDIYKYQLICTSYTTLRCDA